MDTTHSSLHFPLTLPKAVFHSSLRGCVRITTIGRKETNRCGLVFTDPSGCAQPGPEGCCWTQGMHSQGQGSVLATHPLGMTLLD